MRSTRDVDLSSSRRPTPPSRTCSDADQRAGAVLDEVLKAGSKVLPGIRHAAVSVVAQKQCRVLASTGDLPRRFESLQFVLDQGPPWTRSEELIHSSWSPMPSALAEFGPRACQLGVTSTAAIRLEWADRTLVPSPCTPSTPSP